MPIVGFSWASGTLGFAPGIAMSALGKRLLLPMRENLDRHMQSFPLDYFEKEI